MSKDKGAGLTSALCRRTLRGLALPPVLSVRPRCLLMLRDESACQVCLNRADIPCLHGRSRPACGKNNNVSSSEGSKLFPADVGARASRVRETQGNRVMKLYFECSMPWCLQFF
ncbi:hypothetical protein COCON_G00200590, partial [Conger conger]